MANSTADIVFCLDASSSMTPCFNGVREHIGKLVSGLVSSGQTKWDVRFDFVAHHASASAQGEVVFRHSSLYHPELTGPLYRSSGQPRFFTNDIEEFKKGLQAVELFGDEAPLVALDFCLDVPWRDASLCRRAIVLMTDEPIETGAAIEMQKSRMRELIEKIMSLRIMLYIVAPQSKGFDELAAVDRCEYSVVGYSGDGLGKENFAELLTYIGKSVSQSLIQGASPPAIRRGLYGQESWVQTQKNIVGE